MSSRTGLILARVQSVQIKLVPSKGIVEATPQALVNSLSISIFSLLVLEQELRASGVISRQQMDGSPSYLLMSSSKFSSNQMAGSRFHLFARSFHP